MINLMPVESVKINTPQLGDWQLKAGQRFHEKGTTTIIEILEVTSIWARCRRYTLDYPNSDYITVIDLDEFRQGNWLYLVTRPDSGDVKPKSLCDCGGHKAGFRDFTRQHSQWCKVYRAPN